MMDDQTKRRINSLRDILVGKVPDPKSQVEQITTALIYKFMSDMDRESTDLGGEPQFFAGEWAKYSWPKLLDPKLGGQDRMNLYTEGITSMRKNTHLPALFREIFKDAFLPFRDPATLSLFLKEVNQFEYSHSEDLGDAYEYLLSIMGSQGDAGQFRTPRHIIDFIVDVVDPKKGEKLLDPACGTAGFLISAFKHIERQNKDHRLNPDERKALVKDFVGYDISPDMVRMSLVNMYLHGFANPEIHEYDSLSSEDRWDDKFDVIMANPPFMTPKGGIQPHKRFRVQANRAEVLFVDYIMEHLKPGGRAGIIVPEGIIFQSGIAYKQLRKNLVEDGLFCVVSLPSGVFNPYAGVKTSILFFDKDVAQKATGILFVKIQNDGFDLGAQRRPITGEQLSIAVSAINAYVTALKETKVTGLGHFEAEIATVVPKSQIAENGDYNLSGERYRVATDYTNAKWPMVKIGDICDLESGSRDKGGAVTSGVYSIGGEQINKDNGIRFGKMKYISENHFSGMKKGILSKGDVLMVKDGATTGKMGFWDYDYPAAVNEHVYIFRAKDQILPKYLFSVLQSQPFQYELRPFIKGIIGGISLEIKNIQIPLPPLEIQENIVAELDDYQKIIDGAKQIIQNWKPKIQPDPEWVQMELADVCEIITDGTHQTPIYCNSGVVFLSSRNVTSRRVDWANVKYISEELHIKLSKRIAPKIGDVLLAKSGTTGVAALVDKDIPFDIYESLALFRPKRILNSSFLLHLLNSNYVATQFEQRIKGVGIRHLHLNELRQIKIPVPPIELQQKIVGELETEQALVDGNRRLVEINQTKITATIKRLTS